MVRTDNEKVTLRRFEDDLYVAGTGSIIMGAWAVVRVFMEILLGSQNIFHLEIDDHTTRVLAVTFIIIMVTILAIIVLRIHFYIGLNAMRAAQGKEYKKGYLTAAKIMTVVSVLGMYSYKTLLSDMDTIDTTIASIIVDLTTIYIYLTVIRSTYLIRKINENNQE